MIAQATLIEDIENVLVGTQSKLTKFVNQSELETAQKNFEDVKRIAEMQTFKNKFDTISSIFAAIQIEDVEFLRLLKKGDWQANRNRVDQIQAYLKELSKQNQTLTAQLTQQ